MNFARRWIEGALFAIAILIIFGIPTAAIVLAAGYVGSLYGPAAYIAVHFGGIVALIATAVAVLEY